jgi:hypothetical protein
MFPSVAGSSQLKYVRTGTLPPGHCAEDFPAGHDAVREMPDADREGQQPNHHKLADRPVTGGDQLRFDAVQRIQA